MPFNSLSGGFNGDDMLISDKYLFPLPKFDNGSGWGIALGFGLNHLGWEINYTRTKHTGSMTDFSDKWVAHQNIVVIDGQLSPFKHSHVRPYLTAGGGYIWLIVDEGAISESDLLDATYGQFLIRAGLGLQVYFWHIYLNANWIYNYAIYSSVAAGGNPEIYMEGDDRVSGIVQSLNLGIGLVFQ